MKYPTQYPAMPDLKNLSEQLACWTQKLHEYGATGIEAVVKRAEKDLRAALARIQKLPIDATLAKREPNAYREILALRPRGVRRQWPAFDAARYRPRLEGALLGRFAGNVLGAPVELWSIERMQRMAKETGQAFPPDRYWLTTADPYEIRCKPSMRRNYTEEGMAGVPCDDDLTYTLLGLLIAEEYGPDFTTEAVGKAWLKYLPFACTAEDVALRNLKKGVPARKAAEKDNPFSEWIGADIRSDPWGFLAPGWPEKAAAMAHQDAWLTHRRQGIYGEMYFSAAIAAAFAVEDPVEALRIGLQEIPRDCLLAQEVRWALAQAPRIKNYKQARAAVDKRYTKGDVASYTGMHPVHTINNACLTIWGVTIGGRDFSRAIGETVAMGLDNDCTAATTGSLVGAVVGKRGIPKHWTAKFENKVHSYLIGKPSFRIDDLFRRFEKAAARTHAR